MLVELGHMIRVVMAVYTMCSGVVMIMPAFIFAVAVLVSMLMLVLMTVNVRMLMAVRHISM